MVDRKPITIDGHVIGEIVAGLSSEVDDAPTTFSTPDGDMRMASLEMPPSGSYHNGIGHGSLGDSGISPGEQRQRHSGPHVAPRRHQHGEPDTGTYEHPAEKGNGPTFRPGLRPRGKTPAEAPPHFTVSDINQRLHVNEPTFPNIVRGGGINRDWARRELAAKPWLRDKILRIAANEEGSSPTGTQAIIESLMNRAEVRGTNLEREARWHRSEGGYYDEGSMGRGALENPRSRGILEHSLEEALAGSNVSNYATDNSSGSLAARERSSGRFRYRAGHDRNIGDTMFSPGTAEPGLARAYDRWLTEKQRNPSGSTASAGLDSAKNIAVTRLGPGDGEPTFASIGTPKVAPSGNAPAAFIMHHTGGRGAPQGVVEDWREHRPGIGTQYIMDRNGVIHDVAKEYGYHGRGHIIPGSGAGAGLSNRNSIGMEVIARDDKDVTPAQVEAAKQFIRQNYPDTPVFGHGEVNPGHREVSEGMTIVNAIRRERGY